MEDSYRDLHTSHEEPWIGHVVISDVCNITAEEIKRALKVMRRRKTPENGFSLNLLIDKGDNATVKRANLFNTTLQTV